MLAAGEGTRCYPFTLLSSKLTQQVCGIPLIEYMLSWFGGTPEIDKLYIVVRHDSTVQVLTNYVQKRHFYLERISNLFNRMGYKVEYPNADLHIEIIRANGWGTGGDLRFAIREIISRDTLEGDFVVCNGDYVTIRQLPNGDLSPQLNLSDIIEEHRRSKIALGTQMTVALFPVAKSEAGRFGVAKTEQTDHIHTVMQFMEKPDPNTEGIPERPFVNAGVYVLEASSILNDLDEYLPDKPGTNLERTLLERLAGDTRPKLAAYLLDLYGWFDVGTLEQLVDVSTYVASRKGGYITP